MATEIHFDPIWTIGSGLKFDSQSEVGEGVEIDPSCGISFDSSHRAESKNDNRN